MEENKLKIRVNRQQGEIEIEGSPTLVAEWWDKLSPVLGAAGQSFLGRSDGHQALIVPGGSVPDVFGEFFSEFRSDITDVDKVLVAASFAQAKDPDRVFTTKSANQLLIDQNIKVGNASECVRRLISMKRAFVISDGKFRLSAAGLEYMKSLKTQTPT